MHSLSAIISGPDVYVVTGGDLLSRDECSRVINRVDNVRLKRPSRDVNNADHTKSRRLADQRHKRATTSQFSSVSKLCLIMSRPVSRDETRRTDVVVIVAGKSWERYSGRRAEVPGAKTIFQFKSTRFALFEIQGCVFLQKHTLLMSKTCTARAEGYLRSSAKNLHRKLSLLPPTPTSVTCINSRTTLEIAT